MRIEISRELDAGDGALEVPWASPDDPSLLYRDLKLNPGEIPLLPECQAFPALADCLAVLNSAGSSVRSVKCDVWSTTDVAEDERMDFNLPYKTGSYVDVVFDDPMLRTNLKEHVAFAARLRQEVRPLRAQAQMEIIVRRCLYHREEVWGHALTLFLHAYGATSLEAILEWNRTLRALTGIMACLR